MALFTAMPSGLGGKEVCKRTTQHGRARGVTSKEIKDYEPEHTLSYWAA